MLSPVSNAEDLVCSLKTPERIEFENTIEGLQEETEEEQWEHNMSMSLSRDGELDMEMQYDVEEDDSDDSDLEYVYCYFIILPNAILINQGKEECVNFRLMKLIKQ